MRRYNPRTVDDPRTLEDASLVQRVAKRDPAAFLELYDRYASTVHGLALRMLGDVLTAEEITQDAFVRLWTRASTFRATRGRFISWLLTITRRLALDRLRKEARRPPIVESSNPADEWYAKVDPNSKGDEARWGSLRFALLELPDEQRVAIELAFYYGLSHSEIAQELGIPLGTAKTRVRLGMQKLRQSWLEAADPNDDVKR